MSPATTATFAATLLVLAVVGWSVGWLAADGEGKAQGLGDPSPSVAVSSAPPPPPSPTPDASPDQTPPPTATPEPTRSNTFAMPDLRGQHFIAARKEATSRKLGVNVRFDAEGRGEDGTVVATNPEPDLYVWPGLTITLYVKGPAPDVEVPELIGQPCGQAKDMLVDRGLTIHSYPSGEEGNVYKTDPVAGTRLKWNGRVMLYCSTSAPNDTVRG